MSAVRAIDEILFDLAPGETRAALVAQGELVELIVERAAVPSLVGNVYLGRATKLVPSMEAAFVDLGTAGTGFLPRDEMRGALDAAGKLLHAHDDAGAAPIGRLVSEGDSFLVQVDKDAVGAKSPRLTARLALPGHWLVYSPCRPGLSLSRRIASGAERARLEAALEPHLLDGEGVVLRTAAEGVAAAPLLEDLAEARGAWQSLLERARKAKAPALVAREPDPIQRVLRDHAGPRLRRIVCNEHRARDRAQEFVARLMRGGEGSVAMGGGAVEVSLHQGREPLFARHEVEDQIARALEVHVDLASGGSLVFGALEALTAIDVNTGHQAGAARFEDTVLAVNLEAAEVIARQVRLRNVAGLIVIDFVHMDDGAARARVADAVRAGFASDPVPVQLGGFTALGLFEMTRKRVRESLADQLLENCDVCAGAARLKSAATVAYEMLRAAGRAAHGAPGKTLEVTLAPAVAAVLEGEAKDARRTVETALGRALVLRPDPGLPRDRYDIVAV